MEFAFEIISIIIGRFIFGTIGSIFNLLYKFLANSIKIIINTKTNKIAIENTSHFTIFIQLLNQFNPDSFSNRILGFVILMGIIIFLKALNI